MESTNLDGIYKKAKIFGAVLISISIAYYLVIFLPGDRDIEEKNRLEQVATKEKDELQKKTAACLSNAEKIKSEIKNGNERDFRLFGVKTLMDIFYSPWVDSCIYITKDILPTDAIGSSGIVFKDVVTDRVLESIEINQTDYYNNLLTIYKQGK